MSGDERWHSWSFMAEIEAGQPDSDGNVRFRPLDRSLAEIVLQVEAWERLGAPQTLEVTVEPYDES